MSLDSTEELGNSEDIDICGNVVLTHRSSTEIIKKLFEERNI